MLRVENQTKLLLPYGFAHGLVLVCVCAFFLLPISRSLYSMFAILLNYQYISVFDEIVCFKGINRNSNAIPYSILSLIQFQLVCIKFHTNFPYSYHRHKRVKKTFMLEPFFDSFLKIIFEFLNFHGQPTYQSNEMEEERNICSGLSRKFLSIIIIIIIVAVATAVIIALWYSVVLFSVV